MKADFSPAEIRREMERKVNEFAAEANKKANEEADEERERSKSKQKILADGVYSLPDVAYEITDNIDDICDDTKNCALIGTLGGALVGFFACCSVCSKNSVGSGLATWLAVIIIGTIIGAFIGRLIKCYNQAVYSKIDAEKEQSENAIAQIYANADSKIKAYRDKLEKETQQKIAAYERNVKMYAQKVLAKAESIAPMVDHAVSMFQRMISHADDGAYMKFIEADFTYLVTTTGISFSYQSRYTNPQDDYIFNKERYRDLNTPAECEGLAQALAKLIINKMKSIYPPNSINITLSHNDAQVILHFKGANKNFIPAKSIM